MAVKKIADVLKNGRGFIGFTVAGDPNFDQSADYIVAMAEAGADVVEIGIAFSDPAADGPTIMAADIRAAAAGSTTEKVFALIAAVRERTAVPLVILTYVNPVFKYGYEKFLAKMAALSVEGIILPDMPLEEQASFLELAHQYDRSLIQLVTLQSKARIPDIVAQARGFVYIVSSLGTTGTRAELTTASRELVAAVREYTDVPTAIGFGISRPDQVPQFAYADAVIAGSAIVDLIAADPNGATEAIKTFVQDMKAAWQNTSNNA